MPTTSRLFRALSKAVGLLLVCSSSALASVQLIPYHAFSRLSGDGSSFIVALGAGSYARWQAPGNLTPLPSVAGSGITWYTFTGISANGNTITGTGLASGAGVAHPSAWRWDGYVNSIDVDATYSSPVTDAFSIGVSEDGSYSYDEVDNQQTGGFTVYKLYKGGVYSLWFTGIAGNYHGLVVGYNNVQGVSKDGAVGFGVSEEPVTHTAMVCVWNSSGQPTYAYGLTPPGITAAVPDFCSQDGHIVVGRFYPGMLVPGTDSIATSIFRWNTLTGQIDYYLPQNAQGCVPSFLSADGLIIGGVVSYPTTNSFVIDNSTRTSAAKGAQDVGTWLVSNNYMDVFNLFSLKNIVINGISDDERTVLGEYLNGPELAQTFIATRPINFLR